MPPRSIVLISLMVLTSICGWAAGAETDDAADAEALRRAGLPAEGPSLLALFRKRTPDADLQARIKTLIAQLGSDSFSQRKEASEELAACGVAAVGLLRKAAHHTDLEIRRRARDALVHIEQSDLSTDVLIAALHVLGRRKPVQLAEVLLEYAPHAPDADIREELCLALAAAAAPSFPPQIGGGEGKADSHLVRALSDKSPIKRAIAGGALGRSGCRTQFPAVRRLMRDPDPQVRRCVALALLEAREKAAVPVLIELLAELPILEAERVEAMLLQISGETAPKGSLDSRRKYCDAWAEWWKQHSDEIDLAKVELAPKWRGYTLAVCMTVNIRGRGARGATGCILEIDALGRTRWQIKGLSSPVDAQVLDEKHVLVTEYRAGQVTERNHEGDVLRCINVPEQPLEARRLPNGNTLITTRHRVFEMNRNDQEVWATNGDRADAIASACPLRGGGIGICYQSGEFVCVDRNGKVGTSFRVGPFFRVNGMHIQGLPNGHILVPLYNDNKVVEFDRDGQEVWSASYPRPISAQRLPNGRTLVASYGGSVFSELDKNGREIKSRRCDVPLMSVRGR